MTAALIAIINRQAGGGRCGRRAAAMLDRLRDQGLAVERRFTHGPGHATNIAREAWRQGEKHFLAVGGDGTAFEVLNGLFPEGKGDPELRVGLLPLGTGNSFLRDFGILGPEAALTAIVRGQARPCDIVCASHSGGELYYMNLLSVGFSATVGGLTNRRFKALGAAGYVCAVVASVAKLKHPQTPIRLDAEAQRDDRPAVMLAFCNSRFTGGTMMMAPDADVSDGQLDIIRVGSVNRMQLLQAFPKIYQGHHVQLPFVEHRRAHRVELLEPVEQDVMVDGEVLPLTLQSLRVLPSALQVWV